MSTVNKSFANDLSYLDPLQSGGSLGNTLWHIEAFGGTDFGVDQPLLEISQGCTEPLLQQALLVLTLSGCTKTETGEQEKNMKLASCSQTHCLWEPLPLTWNSVHKEREGLYPQEVFAVYCPCACQHKEDTWADALILHILSSNYRGGGVRDMSTCEKQPGGEMAKWVKRKEWVLGQRDRLGDGAKGYCVVGGWETTYEWGKSSQGWQDEEDDGRQVDGVRKRVRWKGYGRDIVCDGEV